MWPTTKQIGKVIDSNQIFVQGQEILILNGVEVFQSQTGLMVAQFK